MKRVKKLYIVTLVLMLGGASSAVADDLFPPTWRGDTGTTQQAWEFDTSASYIETANPFGTVKLYVDSLNQWIDTYEQHSGIWPLAGEIDIEIPNKDGGSHKDIRIQLTWKSAIGMDLATKGGVPYQPNIAVATEPYYEWMKISRIQDTDLGAGWMHSVFDVEIWPNPSIEWLTVKGNILVDELVVDTRCVPEPATMALLGVGAFLGLRRRNRC